MTTPSDNLAAHGPWDTCRVTRFRYHSAILVTAVLAALASAPFLYEGVIALGQLPGGTSIPRSLLVLVPLVPLAIAVWAFRAGTDANAYGIRVRPCSAAGSSPGPR